MHTFGLSVLGHTVCVYVTGLVEHSKITMAQNAEDGHTKSCNTQKNPMCVWLQRHSSTRLYLGAGVVIISLHNPVVQNCAYSCAKLCLSSSKCNHEIKFLSARKQRHEQKRKNKKKNVEQIKQRRRATQEQQCFSLFCSL